VQPKLRNVQSTDHLTHTADVIAVGMREDREVNGADAIVGLDVLDKGETVVSEAGVNDDHRLGLSVRPGKAHADGVARSTAVADWQEVNLVHACSSLRLVCRSCAYATTL
jgi:hypothetical protein